MATHFYTGNILLKNGQNISGWIKNDPISYINYRVNFKANLQDAKTTQYDTSTVAAIKISNGEEYELLHFKTDEMDDSMAVLGKLMVKGKLYFYKIFFKGKTIFLVKSNNKVYCLQDDEFVSLNSADVIEHNFRKKLDAALMHDPNFVTSINNLSFKEDDLISLISKYNTGFNSGNEISKTKNEHTNFLIFGLGGGYKNKSDYEVYFNGAFRAYFPRISKGTSLNVGISYFHEKYTVAPQSIYQDYEYNTSDLISMPVQIQENFLNKNIRPYLFGGFNISYIKDVDQYGVSQTDHGFQGNFGIGLLFGGGIEMNIYKGLIIKGEYRYENYSHPVLFGLAYAFKTR